MRKFLICLMSAFVIFLMAIVALVILKNSKKEEIVIPKDYGVSPLILVLDWEIEKPFNMQVFYINKKDAFSEGESIRKNVKPADKHLEIQLPVDKIRGLRIDFGSNPGQVIIKNIEVKADHFINFNNWGDWRFVNIDEHATLSNNSLRIKSKHKDPYMYYSPQMDLAENTEFDVFMREQYKIVEQNLPPQPTTAKIIISGKPQKKKLPIEVFLNGSSTSLPPTPNGKGNSEYFIIIEPVGMETTIDIKPTVSYAEYKISLSKPENDEKYIKYTLFQQGDLVMIHPKVPSYISSATPFESNATIKSSMVDHYKIKWQKVQELQNDIE